MQGLCSSTAGVGVHAAGSERKQWLREDPCGAAQLDNRSVRGGPAVFGPLALHASVLLAASPRSCCFTRQARVTSLGDRCVDSFLPAGYHLALAPSEGLEIEAVRIQPLSARDEPRLEPLD